MSKYFIKTLYFTRRKRVVFDDRSNNKDIIWQNDVYNTAGKLMSDHENIVDFGCGNGQKLFQLSLINRARIIGIDYDKNISFCINAYKNNIEWIENDFDSEESVDLHLEGKSLFICADVIEHLLNPENLLYKIKANMKKNDLMVISTPERDLVRGKFHIGPPNNFNHIREWNEKEFKRFLVSKGFIIQESRIIHENNLNVNRNTQMHIVYL